MKAMVIYDSGFGNTAQIAEAITQRLAISFAPPHSITIRSVAQVTPAQLQGLDVLVVGSPTQRCRPTPAISALLKRIPNGTLQGVKVAAFDTRFTSLEIDTLGFIAAKFIRFFGYAAKPIADLLQKKGGALTAPPEGFYVEGMEGPLMEGELQRAANWAEVLVSKCVVVA